MLKSYYTLIIFVIIFFASCNDYAIDDLSGGYRFHYLQPDEEYIRKYDTNKKVTKAIYGTIDMLDYNSDFIVVKQSPIFELYRLHLSHLLHEIDSNRFPRRATGELEYREKIADSILRHDPFYQKMFSSDVNYWIIVHEQDTIIGPLSYEMYKKKREELDIPSYVSLE